MQEIVDALVAGAAAGSQDAASSAVGDAYRGLRTLVARRLAGRARAETALTEVEAQAGAEGQVDDAARGALAVELRDAGSDDEVLDAARRLLALLGDPGHGSSADRYRIDARHAQGMIVNARHNTITQNFGDPGAP